MCRHVKKQELEPKLTYITMHLQLLLLENKVTVCVGEQDGTAAGVEKALGSIPIGVSRVFHFPRLIT